MANVESIHLRLNEDLMMSKINHWLKYVFTQYKALNYLQNIRALNV